MRTLTAIWLVLSMLMCPAAAEERSWPRAPWHPHLTFVADGREELCADYETAFIAKFFEGYPDLEMGPDKFEYIEELEWSEDNYDTIGYIIDGYMLVDLNNDGEQEYILKLISQIGYARTGYQSHYSLHTVAQGDFSALKAALVKLAAAAEERISIEQVREVVKTFEVTSFDPRLNYETQKKIPPEDRKKLPVDANFLRGSFRTIIRENKALISKDTLNNPFSNLHGTLVSFEDLLNPKVECEVTGEPPETFNRSVFTTGQNLKGYLTAALQTNGSPEHYSNGSSRKHYHYISTKGPSEILNQPWHFLRDGKIEPPNWRRTYHYFWSLQGAWNARAFASFASHFDAAVIELGAYIEMNFDLSHEQAEIAAHNYLIQLRLNSYSRGNYAFGHRTYKLDDVWARIGDSDASAEDFITFSAIRKKTPNLDEAFRIAIASDAKEKILTELQSRGAHVNNVNDNSTHETPLMLAIGRPQIVSYLLKNGAMVDQSNYFGKTPLMLAAHMNAQETLEVLLAANASIELRTKTDFYSPFFYQIHFGERTALMYAAENASLTLIKTLLDAGADASALDERGRGMLDYLKRNTLLSEGDVTKAGILLQSAGALN